MFKNQLQKISKSSGVYFWLDNRGKVLYVGRATNLKNRLSQYFLSNVEPRIKEMVFQAKKIKTIETKTLLEAIILEAKYIKKYWPKYNIKDRDDRSFIYIVIAKKDFTYPVIIRGKDLQKYQDKNNQIFGPYQSFTLIKNALRIIRRIFPYGTCKANSGKPCFDYQVGLCPGSCLGKINKKDYQKNIKNIILLLSGKKEYLIKKLSQENPEQLKALKHLQDVSLIENEKNLEQNNFKRIEAYDISHFSGKETYGSMIVVDFEGEYQKNDYRLFKIKNNYLHDDFRALTETLERRLKHKEWMYPDLFLIDGGRPQLDFLKEIFEKYKIKNVVGLSKFAGDEIIFLKNVDKKFKKEVLDIKLILLKARDEAHRFANLARKKAKKI
ncbi:MAG TPA: GIY-YIG nuclease family protein [bacterium]|nr:GIY-YIG nuclease family protein [bacterium]HPV65271.1 GIY-YIG nuclease family protein [bacterium]